MKFAIVRPLLLPCALLFLPALFSAQEAVLIGTITDATGAVLPDVTVQATHESPGNTFEAVIDSHGIYRIPVKKKTPA
jgi:carboxypeptidase family protein